MKKHFFCLLVCSCIIPYVASQQVSNPMKDGIDKAKGKMTDFKDKTAARGEKAKGMMGRKKRGTDEDSGESKESNPMVAGGEKAKGMMSRKKRGTNGDFGESKESEPMADMFNKAKGMMDEFGKEMVSKKGNASQDETNSDEVETTTTAESARKKRFVHYSVHDLIEKKYTVI